jgi:hypothetical protein
MTLAYEDLFIVNRGGLTALSRHLHDLLLRIKHLPDFLGQRMP